MARLIYYPGFEVADEMWLKLALLFIEEINPIMPQSAIEHLSPLHNKIRETTDLIKGIQPDYQVAYTASLDVIDTVEQMIKHPSRYYRALGSTTPADSWRAKDNQTHVLFSEKYTSEWEAFCLDNGFASRGPVGIWLPQQLAFIYMSVLAQVIGDKEDIAVTTDMPPYDSLAVLARRVDVKTEERIKVAQSIINLQLPCNLASLTFEDLINFRNKEGYRERLKAFHKQLDAFYTNLESDEFRIDFIESLDSVYRDLRAVIMTQGCLMGGFALGCWVSLHSGISPSTLGQLAAAGGLGFIGSVHSIRKSWNHSQSKRFARKYLMNLRELRPGSHLGRR